MKTQISMDVLISGLKPLGQIQSTNPPLSIELSGCCAPDCGATNDGGEETACEGTAATCVDDGGVACVADGDWPKLLPIALELGTSKDTGLYVRTLFKPEISREKHPICNRCQLQFCVSIDSDLNILAV